MSLSIDAPLENRLPIRKESPKLKSIVSLYKYCSIFSSTVRTVLYCTYIGYSKGTVLPY